MVDAAGDDKPITVYDLHSADEVKVDLRRLPLLLRGATGMVWVSGRREFLLSTALQLVSGVGIAFQLFLGRGALDALFGLERGAVDLSAVVPWAVGVAALTAVLMFTGAVQREQQQILGELVSRHVQGTVLDVASDVELAAFEHPSFHNRLQRVMASYGQPLNMVFGISGVGGALIGVVGVGAALVAIEPLLIPMLLLVLVPAWLIASRRSVTFYRFFWKLTPRDRERRYLGELLSGRESAKELRAFTLSRFLRRRHDDLYEQRIAELRRVARRQLWYTLVSTLVIGVFLAATVLLIAWLATTGRVALAEAGVAVAGVAVVGARLTTAGYAAGSLAEAALFMEDHAALLAIAGDEKKPGVTGPAPIDIGRITVEDVSFTYPSGDSPALRNLSLFVEPGEVVALVGENGSGKTTLAKLLAGLYRPDSGRICWDGVDLAGLEQREISQRVAVIFQDFLQYHLAARDNISLGRFEKADVVEAVEQAATQAGAHEFITELASGYETMLGPEFFGGVDLSVGQWQRLALARAFFRDAPFVILDEPTASLDAKAEHELFARIHTLLRERTVLLISHRFSSVRNADRIYVLNKGEVTEHGTHSQLMALGGHYAQLFSLQAEAYQS